MTSSGYEVHTDIVERLTWAGATLKSIVKAPVRKVVTQKMYMGVGWGTVDTKGEAVWISLASTFPVP